MNPSLVLLLLAVSAWAGPLTGPEPPPAWLSQAGLSKQGDIWIYERGHPRRPVRVRRALSAQELATLDPLLAEGEGALQKAVIAHLETQKIPPDQTVFFSSGERQLELNAHGKECAPGIMLGDPYGERFQWPEESTSERVLGGRISLDRMRYTEAMRGAADADGASYVFDNGGRRSGRTVAEHDGVPIPLADRVPLQALSRPPSREFPSIALVAGTYPYSIPLARNLESVYHAVGWGGDRLIELAFDERDGAGAIVTRIVKMPADIFMAGFISWITHETAHMITADRAGAKDVGFAPADGLTVSGLTVLIDDPDEKITEHEDLILNMAGMHATQAAARDLRRRVMLMDRVPWSAWPLYIAHKQDPSSYIFLTAKPGHPKAEQEDWDTVDWRELYSKLSGKSERHIHRQMVAGAFLNALDPMAVSAFFNYFYRYLIKGEESAGRPMLGVGEQFQVGAGTGFWMAQNGPWFTGDLYMRHNPSGTMVSVTPSFGDRGQWAGEAELSVKPARTTRLSVFGSVWQQRDGPESGGRDTGGGVGLSVAQELGAGLGIEARGGWKSKGAWLGRDFDEGAFGEGGIRYGF